MSRLCVGRWVSEICYRACERRPDQVRRAHVGAVRLHTDQMCAVEIRVCEVRRDQVSAAEVGA